MPLTWLLPSARNSAWLPQRLLTDVRLKKRLNKIFCSWGFSIYSMHDVIGPFKSMLKILILMCYKCFVARAGPF